MQVEQDGVQAPSFRLDVPLHSLLTKPVAPVSGLQPVGDHNDFQIPFFHNARNCWDRSSTTMNGSRPKSAIGLAGQIYHAMRGWLFPYIRSRVTAGDFHPLIAYLFTEFKCNLDCHYCWAFDNKVKGMTEDTAKRSIDWLHGTGCRVLAYMGVNHSCGRT